MFTIKDIVILIYMYVGTFNATHYFICNYEQLNM